ncbi:helix-turn-helix transcriptional regulator [Micromonospora sp. NPDC000663]|uniref:helix-turn-helix transcriptional regulator n=1 Tax=Micromonospora sp. NPDC000663 TaxID=3364218 RepID=UPI0036C976A5
MPNSSGAFMLNAEGAQGGQKGFDAYLEAYANELGEPFRHPTYSASTAREFTGTFQNVALDGIVIATYQAESRIRTAEVGALEQDQIRLYAVHRGALLLNDPTGRGDVRLTPGRYFLGHITQDHHFDTTSPIAALALLLPGHLLRRLLAGKPTMGATSMAPLRLLVAHAETIRQNLPHLGPRGREGAASALVELLKGVVFSEFDQQESAFVPALVRASRELSEELLESEHLTPELIAACLHVSVRTLQRSFATTDEPLSAYIRRRRLEEATRLLLATPSTTISEAAARWHFTDSSHFVRTFKKQYGCTPSDYLHRRRSPGEARPWQVRPW